MFRIVNVQMIAIMSLKNDEQFKYFMSLSSRLQYYVAYISDISNCVSVI